jgi:hypothetical protein
MPYDFDVQTPMASMNSQSLSSTMFREY